MELSELTAYAEEKYQIEEQHKWPDFPGFSVLCHPQTGKWVALLMRQWDMDTGTEIERCDLKCGREDLFASERRLLSAPFRMRGPKWVGIAPEKVSDPDVIFRLFDRAITAGIPYGFTIELDSQGPSTDSPYQETSLPFSGSSYQPPREDVPTRLRQMRRYFDYSKESAEDKRRNFYRQARFMEDYEDDFPWEGYFRSYFPTYQDLTTKQLRGYFSWRTLIRKGVFHPIAESAAYIYIYELLNGIGASSPEDSLEKLRNFETGYLDSGIGGPEMRRNLRRWMFEFAVITGLPEETVLLYADPEMLENDAALGILRRPAEHTDEEVVSALCRFSGKKMLQSPVFTNDPERGRHLFAEAWRNAEAGYRREGKMLHILCFGYRTRHPWYPLANAVFWQPDEWEDRECQLDEFRTYRCRNGAWQVSSFEKLGFDKDLLQSFLHETDLMLRRYLKTGRYLKKKADGDWAVPFIEAAIESDRKSAEEAARPKVTIDLSGLEQIRRDALTTRDSLLTEEERMELEGPGEGADETAGAKETIEEKDDILEAYISDIPLDAVHFSILRALLRGESAGEIIRENHLMPSVAADTINEALFDEIGDVAVLCEDDKLSLMEDYRDELDQLLGGTHT